MHRQSTKSNKITQVRIFGSDDESRASALAKVFPGAGEMATIMRGVDWAKTPLGPVASWPLALRMMAKFLLANRFPLLLWWGPQFCQLYNDAYRPVLGTKHPQFVGRPVSECWHEIWHILEPLIRTPFEGGPATWMEDIPLEINRHGFVEETHFTIAYSPVPDDTVPTGIGGVLATVHEISEKVIGERRVMALRDLGAGSSETRTAEQACARATEILSNYPKDLPFAMLYLLDSDRTRLRLAGTAGVEAGRPISPDVIELDGSNTMWPLGEVLDSDQMQITEGLANRFVSPPLGPWADPPDKAVLIPIRSNVAHQPAGLLVAGISPRLRFDDNYRGFVDLASSQIAIIIANARAYEEERKRAEALAEIDRAKTVFFSNVSHEFRTPLTLILGPIEHTLSEAGLPPELHKRLQLAYRNSVRLLKLVNTLLDFSRIEAGRAEAVYQPTDLATFTKELATFFESVTGRAGLELRIECPPLDEPVYVDREMWEKIVLNLMSNAFKFTLQGGISLSLMDRRDAVVLTVKDTGVGISASDLPRLFERFHRVEGSQGRTFEGSGIGLALVQELVKLHGGNVSVESIPDKGSTFIVCIPKGYAHLPQARIEAARSMVSTALGANAYVEEAMRWIEEHESPSSLPSLTQGSDPSFDDPALEDIEGSVVILADDNADMRDYVRRLLGRHFRTVVVSNGKRALDAALREHPDLILTDVMMPVLDGFGLLKAIRANPQTSTIPVLMLSARAGEESHAEGLQAGADDYLAKPFTARELLARVTSLLRLNKVRRDATRLIQEREEQLRQANAELAQRMAELRKANSAANDSRRAALNLTQDAVRSRQELETVNMALREGEERLRSLLDYQAAITNNMAEGLYTLDAQGLVTFMNPAAEAILGWTKDELIGRKMHEMCHYKHEDGTPASECPGLEVMENGKQLKEHEDVFIRKDGSLLPVTLSAAPLRADRRIVGVVVGFRDDTLRRQAESALKESHATLERTVEYRTAAIRELSSSLLRSQDDERRRISRELHDSLGQYLAHAKMSLVSLKRSDATEKEDQGYTHLTETIEKCLTETRTLSHLLHPPLLDEVGLSSAAEWYVQGFSERSGIPVKFEIVPPDFKRLPAAIELALFRILQESLTNIHRHSHSPSVDVQLSVGPDGVELRIRDYGEGIAAERLRQFRTNGTGVGIGIRSMRERITELGGQFELQSDSNGTTILVTTPILSTTASSVA